MDRKELSDIILRNVSGAKSALNTHADYEKYDKKDMERHRSYLDALKGYFNIYNENILQENCLKGVQDYLISQYSFIPTNVMPEIDTGKITKTKVGTAIYYSTSFF